MPKPSSSPEARAINAAYEEHVQTLFRGLITNIGEQPVTHKTDEELLARFAAGLDVAKRARTLALSAAPKGPVGVA